MNDVSTKVRAKVFIPQQPSRWDPLMKMRVPTVELSAATVYGDLVPMLPMGMSPLAAAPIKVAVREILRNMRADDYIMPVGHPAIIAIVCALALDMHRRIRLLVWHGDTKQYSPIDIDI